MEEQQANPPIGQMIDKETKLFGYIAEMATSSKIPKAFSKYCLASGDNASMVGLNIREDDLAFTLNGMKTSQIQGALISQEYGKQAISAMDHITKEAEIAGFIDAFVVQNGKLIGHIATGNVIAQLIEPKETKRVAMYGAGSLARSIVLNLDETAFEEIVFYVERVESAMELIEAVSPYISKLRFDIERATKETAIDAKDFDVVVNASSVGKFAHDKVIALQNVEGKQLLDIAYNKKSIPSLFEQYALDNQARYIGGYDIIAYAAKIHYSVWFEKDPKDETMYIERG